MKKLLILVSMAGFVACSSVKTVYDYDRNADFTKYKSYKLTTDDLEASVGQLNRERIITALDNEMTAKGFSKSENPDMLVNVHIKSRQKVDATATTSGGYGRWGWYGGYSTTHVSYNEYTEGTLFITFIDNEEQKIFWQGTGTKTLDENASPEKREQNITYSVKLILENYPPKK